jgi:hypothetical protein
MSGAKYKYDERRTSMTSATDSAYSWMSIAQPSSGRLRRSATRPKRLPSATKQSNKSRAPYPSITLKSDARAILKVTICTFVTKGATATHAATKAYRRRLGKRRFQRRADVTPNIGQIMA